MEATDRRAEANRENAQWSTGPRTPTGKAASARNSLRHGLLARETVLPDEDPAAFDAFADDLLENLAPSGAVEELLAARVVDAAWRLRRAARIEDGLLAAHYHAAEEARAQAVATRYVEDLAGPFPPEITNKLRHAAAIKRAAAARETADARDDTLLGLGFARDAAEADALGKLARYEAALERSLYRALHELQRLQAARAGADVPLPAAVDVTVSAGGFVSHTGASGPGLE